METYQEKAWSCLTKQEQDSLFLNISQGLSTRRTGEVLHITHYKYLELKARAEKFFKMFSDYSQSVCGIVPLHVKLPLPRPSDTADRYSRRKTPHPYSRRTVRAAARSGRRTPSRHSASGRWSGPSIPRC